MKRWLGLLLTAMLFIVAVLETGTVTHVFAATKKIGTTSDGFSYKILSKDGTVEITGYKGKKKKLVIPDKIDGKKVTQIGEFIFKGNKYIMSVEIPDGVKKVDGNAFNFCETLKSITVSKSVEDIGGGEGFSEYPDSKLERVEVSPQNKIYYFREGVLFKKENNEKILLEYPCGKKGTVYEIPKDTTVVVMSAFYGEYLSTLKIPSGVKEFLCSCDEYGFSSWAGCTEIIVDEANNFFYSKDGVLFNNGDELLLYPAKKTDKRYEVPDGTTKIEAESFKKNQYIEDIIMPDSVRTIGRSAFEEANNLKSVDTVANICDTAFSGCEKLVHLNLREGAESVGEDAFWGTALEQVTLPESVNFLDLWAINPRKLKRLEIRNKDCIIKKGQGVVNRTVIYGYADSTAEAYAKQYGYQFKLIGSEEIPGEDNSEGTITKNTVKLSKISYTYDGKAKKPEVIVKDKSGNRIPKDCYMVSYKK